MTPLKKPYTVYTGTERSLWRFLGFGVHRELPLHPLHHLQELTRSQQTSVTKDMAAVDDAEAAASHRRADGDGVLSPEQARLTRRIVRAAAQVQQPRAIHVLDYKGKASTGIVMRSGGNDGGGSSSSSSSGGRGGGASAHDSDDNDNSRGDGNDRQARSHRKRGATATANLQVDVTEEQKLAVIARYVAGKWYAPLYRPFRHYTDQRIRSMKRRLRVMLFLWYTVSYTLLLLLYYDEMRTVMQLPEEDRRDYVYMATNMRYSDIRREGRTALDRLDPHGALPMPARYHIVVEACRARGWHRVHWETQLRVLHPRSAFEDLDWEHLLYWLMMYVGKTTAASSSYFSDRFANLVVVPDTMRAAAREEQFVVAEPVGPPRATATVV